MPSPLPDEEFPHSFSECGNFLDHNKKIMKKFIFLILIFLLCFTSTFSVFAKTHNDNDCFILFTYTTSAKTHMYYSWQRATTTMRSVHISGANTGRIIDCKEGSFYAGGCSADNYPSEFKSSELRNLSVDSKFTKFELYNYTSSGFSHIYDSSYYDYTFESLDAFYEELNKYNSYADFIKQNDSKFDVSLPTDEKYLPMLHYSLEKNHVIGFPNLLKVKEIFKWDYTEHDIYRDNPSDYCIEIVASTNLKDADNGIGKVFDAYTWTMNDTCKVTVTSGKKFVSVNQYSFMYDDVGKSIYSKLGQTWEGSTCGYYLYIRTKSNVDSKVSCWKVYKVYFGGYVSQMGIIIDESGNSYDLNDDDWDIRDDYDNGEYDEDNTDDASEDDSSDLYDETGISNASTVVANLKSIVTTLGEIPPLISMVFSWLPDYIIVLISVGIGLIVIVGIVKWVL